MNEALKLQGLTFEQAYSPDIRSRYFNTAGGGQVPKRLSMAVTDLLSAYDEIGAMSRRIASETEIALDAARKSVSRCLGVEPNQVSLTDSATSALAALATSLDFPAGAVILIGEDEHPSLEIPFLALRRRGAKIIRISGEIAPEEQPIPGNVSICALSLTSYRTGRNLHPRWLPFANEMGALFIADATQTFGLQPLSLKDRQNLALVGNGHKWLHGPLGTGFIYADDGALARLRPSGGWRSICDPDDHHRIWENTRAFDSGTLCFPAFAGLAVTCAWWANEEFCSKMIADRREKAHAIASPISDVGGLNVVHENAGFLCLSSRKGFSFDARKLAEEMWRRGEFEIKPFSPSENPNGGVRISVSPFNDIQDCEALGERLLRAFKNL